jgi:hypothetical protein
MAELPATAAAVTGWEEPEHGPRSPIVVVHQNRVDLEPEADTSVHVKHFKNEIRAFLQKKQRNYFVRTQSMQTVFYHAAASLTYLPSLKLTPLLWKITFTGLGYLLEANNKRSSLNG